MGRYKITVAYDGTNYAGWQVQPDALTVQEVLEGVLQKFNGGSPVKVHGSGRTDSGVHARGQVAHFDLERPFDCKALLRACNACLPEDIRVMRSQRAARDFHARKSAVGKEYRYFIWNNVVLSPRERLTHLHVRSPLDVAAMRQAASVLVGRHDFAAFTANPKRFVESTVREVFRLDVVRRGREVVIVAEGEGFLYKMVRSLAGWLVRVGRGEVSPQDTQTVLESRVRTADVPTAQPQGLSLWKVKY